MFDIGFQSLSRMLASGMNIKVFVLDTQVYSNTGGQASTSSYMGQNTKMSVHGKVLGGKQEKRKEIAQICMMHPNTYVAQTTCAHYNHFYKSVLGALEYEGPAIVICYTTCQPEHGVADNLAAHQARLAVDSRAFPLLIYDPRKGERIRERLSLQGNPAPKEDWYRHPKTVSQSRLLTLPARKADSPSTSIKTAILRRRYWPPCRIAWRTGGCCKNLPACAKLVGLCPQNRYALYRSPATDHERLATENCLPESGGHRCGQPSTTSIR
jgi:pyruvate/2-oxoacid:ferredoxin oxidoreductase beta subunit